MILISLVSGFNIVVDQCIYFAILGNGGEEGHLGWLIGVFAQFVTHWIEHNTLSRINLPMLDNFYAFLMPTVALW